MPTVLLALSRASALPSGLDGVSIGSTVLYAVLGVLLLILFAWIVSAVFRLDLRRELVEDQNTGLGLAVAGGFIAVALIISATILS